MSKPKPNKQPISDRAVNELFQGTTMAEDTITRKRGLMIDCILCYAAGRRDSYTLTSICIKAGFLTAAKRPSKVGIEWAWTQLYNVECTILERITE